MQFPRLSAPEIIRDTVSVFRGYHAGPGIGTGELADMQNLTSDDYPLLASRKGRGDFARPANGQGLVSNNGLCWVDGSRLVISGQAVELQLSVRPEDCPKRLIAFGAYILIFPDKKYINTADLTDFGQIEAEYRTRQRVNISPCDGDGAALIVDAEQEQPPASPENGILWLNTSAQPPELMRWNGGTSAWVSAGEICMRLSAQGIGADFREEDVVRVQGLPAALCGEFAVCARGQDFLVLECTVTQTFSVTGDVTVSRKMPVMDHMVECGNRLWGCRYGRNAEGKMVNEIYASKLGDFRSWNSFRGTAEDSYVMSMGEDGGFTGAARYMDCPVFFREKCLHRIYGSYPAAYRLHTVLCPGIQPGSERSPAVVDQILYYKSAHGVRAFDGTVCVEVSRDLGVDRYRSAVAAGFGSKYYISMADAGGEYHLFVYDTVRKLWHREDSTRVVEFCAVRQMLYFLDGTGAIRTVTGNSTEQVQWMAETGDLGLEYSDNKYLIRLTLRLWLEAGAQMQLKIQYDSDGIWHPAGTVQREAMGSVTLPLQVRRCDHLRLRMEGKGGMRLYSVTKTAELGSDVF